MEISVIAAQSLDGFIAKHQTPGTAFTSKADKLHFSRMLSSFDVSIMGRSTYETSKDLIRSRLNPARCRFVMTRSPDTWAAEAVDGQLEFTREAPSALIERLRKQGHRRCAILGGSQIHSLFLESGLVDFLIITLEPRLFGQGVPFLHHRADLSLTLASTERLADSDSLLLTYRVKK